MWVYINKEEEGWKPDNDWNGEITKRSGGVPPDDLIDRHGHANSTWEKSPKKGENEAGVTFRTMEREAKKAFGSVGKASTKTEKSGKIKSKGIDFDLQFFAIELPKDRILRYIREQKKWEKGDDERLLSYTEENVRKAIYYYEKNLKVGLKAPDGAEINITEDDFYKIIKDPKMLHKPEWVKEVIVNAQVKIKQRDGRYLYLSFNPAGYIATGEITYSSHHFGSRGQGAIQEKIESAIRRF